MHHVIIAYICLVQFKISTDDEKPSSSDGHLAVLTKLPSEEKKKAVSEDIIMVPKIRALQKRIYGRNVVVWNQNFGKEVPFKPEMSKKASLDRR